ncbi:MAG: GGDEF domain-containing phosphodiesterase [Gemmatimonadota bacterium]
MAVPAHVSQTLHDPLTGLAGEALLGEVGTRLLGLARRYGRWSCVLHLRVGGIGHALHSLHRPEQALLLRRIGRRLNRCLRETDVVARVGPDRFAIVLSDFWEAETCAGIARRMLHELGTLRVPGRRCAPDVRIGVAIFPNDAEDLDVLLHQAARACNRVHGPGASLEFHDTALGARLQASLEIGEDLQHGSARSQMFLAFQPIFSLDGDRLVGAEALSRWHHPTRGTLIASSFIPQAERSGRILTIDRWALESAVSQARDWRRDGWDGWVSVNMSARSFAGPHVVPLVLNTLRKKDVDADALVVEITESEALGELPAAVDTIAELQRQGVRVAIDDFGSGYASFRYVNELDASFIKIDRSFLLAADREARHARLLESMIDMAHQMEKPVISEGVENNHQRDRLAAAGCDFMQGWLNGEAIDGVNFGDRWLA